MNKLITLRTILALFTVFSFAQDEAAKEEVTKVEVSINPANPMMYNSAGFEVPAGAKIELTFNNNGPLPKMAGGHNIVILKSGVTAFGFAPPVGMATMTVAQGAKEDYLTDDQKAQTIAFTKVLGPNEKDVITFTAPEAGTYEYVCTFPGHFAAMKGTMTVK